MNVPTSSFEFSLLKTPKTKTDFNPFSVNGLMNSTTFLYPYLVWPGKLSIGVTSFGSSDIKTGYIILLMEGNLLYQDLNTSWLYEECKKSLAGN
jgi:hypothetical protein